MTASNGWPGEPGVPMNPQLDGWHWVSLLGSDHPQIMEWFSDAMVWADDWTVEACAMHLRYLGPVLTPDEVANREDAKWHEGYAVGVLDVRRGTAFGEPDPHYAALQKRVAELERALREMIYETTHLSPQEDDGSHWCKISKSALEKARAALEGKKE